jgi:hypothetical protein
MYATIRRYAGNSGLASQLAGREGDVVAVISETPGLRAYYLVSAGADTISVTVCDDESGAQKSNELAAAWIRENMPEAASSAPEVSAGEVVVTTAG